MSHLPEDELTPVDDTRRVRDEIDRECGGDVQRVADYAIAVGEALREKLGLKLVQPPTKSRQDEIAG